MWYHNDYDRLMTKLMWYDVDKDDVHVLYYDLWNGNDEDEYDT